MKLPIVWEELEGTLIHLLLIIGHMILQGALAANSEAARLDSHEETHWKRIGADLERSNPWAGLPAWRMHGFANLRLAFKSFIHNCRIRDSHFHFRSLP